MINKHQCQFQSVFGYSADTQIIIFSVFVKNHLNLTIYTINL